MIWSLSFILSFITTLISLSFTVLIFKRWAKGRREYMLAWGIGMIFYTIGVACQTILSQVWSEPIFALWYWTGALMTAAWLGQGTAYLLIRRGNIARNLQMALILVAVMTLPWTLFFTDYNADAWQPGVDMTEIYRDTVDESGTVIQQGIMPGSARGTVRFFSPIMNIWGTLLLVGGALYSSWMFSKKAILRQRVIGNWFIAAGGLLPALSGAFIRIGIPSFKYFGEMAGAALIFIGFLYATGSFVAKHKSTKPTAVTLKPSDHA
ncbi:hypothetical protein MASR2M15_05300 [Anaerolineales bacterium]